MYVEIVVFDECLYVVIIDKGFGVLDKFKNKIFELFFIIKIYGMGFGFVVVKFVVNVYNGLFSVLNMLEGGVCFSVFLLCVVNV